MTHSPPKKGNTTRNMHYLPQCYLKGFAAAPSKSSQLHVFDMNKDCWFSTIPRNVGARRDFLRVNIPGQQPDMVEGIFSDYETRIDAILSTMREAQQMPTGEDYGHLIGLVALIGVRNPLVRQSLNQFQTEVLDLIAQMQVGTKERYEAGVKNVQEAGRAPGPPVSYEDMLKFIDDKQYKVEIENTLSVSNEFKLWPTITQVLLDRKWALVIAGKGANFVSSDHPVSLTWSDPKFQRGPYPPGFGMSSTEVVFPVTKEMALIGTYEGENRTVRTTPFVVASINSRIISNTDYQIYSPRPEFAFLGGDGQIYPSGRLQKFLRRVPAFKVPPEGLSLT